MKSHKVQSVRVVVENVFADIKKWKVMESNKFKTVAMFELVLDCVLGLYNFRVLSKHDRNYSFPSRRAAILGEHIFQSKVATKDVKLNIPPNPPDLALANLSHISRFINFLPSVAPALKEALKLRGDAGRFFPTVRERGRQLNEGAYLLQLKVQPEVWDTWTVKYIVGASYSYEKHTGYVKMRRENAVVASICDCFSG